jgi:hypothetical protein
MRKHWEKFIQTLDADKEIIETYYKLRKIFQREEWSEKDLTKPPYYPNDLMRLFQKFNDVRDKLFFEIRSYFGDDVDFSDFADYLKDKLYKIDLITPLNDGDYERRDSWDEDIE